MYLITSILSFLFWPTAVVGLLIIGLVIFFVRKRGKSKHPSANKEWYLSLALSKEDAVSQLFLLLSFFFLGVTLLAFNRDLGDLLTWRAVLVVTSLAGLVGAYYFKAVYILAFSLVGLASWWAAQAIEWVVGKDIKASAIIAGLSFLALLFHSIGHLHEKEIRYKRFALVYLILGIIAAVGVLFFLSTKAGIIALARMTQGASFFGSWQLTISLMVFFAGVVGATVYGAAQKLISFYELLAVFVLAMLFGVMALLPEQAMFVGAGRSFYYIGNELSRAGVLWLFIYNVAIFFTLLGIILSGYLRRETWLINLGALFLFLLIIVKYFDWFFTFLDKSIFFISAGVLLFVVGWFMERGRRYMIGNLKGQKRASSTMVP